MAGERDEDASGRRAKDEEREPVSDASAGQSPEAAPASEGPEGIRCSPTGAA